MPLLRGFSDLEMLVLQWNWRANFAPVSANEDYGILLGQHVNHSTASKKTAKEMWRMNNGYRKILSVKMQ